LSLPKVCVDLRALIRLLLLLLLVPLLQVLPLLLPLVSFERLELGKI
jgi:hypothetical protein